MSGRVKLTQRELNALRGVVEGRAVRPNENGPALDRHEFGTAVAMAVRSNPLTRILSKTVNGATGIELTDAGRSALANQNGDSDHG